MDKRVDVGISAFIAVLGAWLILKSRAIPHGSIHDPLEEGGLIAAIGGFFILAGITLAVRRLMQWGSDGNTVVPSEGVEDEPGISASAVRAFAVWGLTAGYVYSLPRLGFVVSTPIYLMVGIALLGLRKWIKGAIFSVVLTGAIFYLFIKTLGVRLPPGSLWS